VLHRDIYHPMIIGAVYCWWTVLIGGVRVEDDALNKTESVSGTESVSDSDPHSLYDQYFEFEAQDFVLWFVLNLTALCGVHSIAAFVKSKMLSTHFIPIRLSSDKTVWIDRNGNIKNTESDESEHLKLNQNDKYGADSKLKKMKKSKRKKKKNRGRAKRPKLAAISEHEIMDEEVARVLEAPKECVVDIGKAEKQSSKSKEKSIKNDDGNSDQKQTETESTTTNTVKPPKRQRLHFEPVSNGDSTNSIKRGFQNLMSIIEPHSYAMAANEDEEADSSSDDTSTSYASGDSVETEDCHDQEHFDEFYSLKCNSDYVATDDEISFNALKTKSMAALLSLSKQLQSIARPALQYRSDCGFSEQETSGMSDDEALFGLKSGLYDRRR